MTDDETTARAAARSSRSKPHAAWWYWAPLAVWLAAIFFFSTDALSAEHTSRFVEPLIRRLLPGASPETVYVVHVAVRKCGHLSEYALLALLAFRAVRRGRPPRFRARWAASAFAIATVYALVDEFHQTFVTSRTGNLRDALLDMAGAGAALALLALARRAVNSRAAADV